MEKKAEDIEERTIKISQASKKKATYLFNKIGFTAVCMNPPEELIVDNCQLFDWGGKAEDQMTPLARSHLQQLLEIAGINFGTEFQLIDVHTNRSLLDFEDKNIGKINGGTDLIITPKGTAKMSYANQICVVFELKTSENIAKNGLEKFIPRSVVEFVSSNFLSYQQSILAVLTDLNQNTFVWKSL